MMKNLFVLFFLSMSLSGAVQASVDNLTSDEAIAMVEKQMRLVEVQLQRKAVQPAVEDPQGLMDTDALDRENFRLQKEKEEAARRQAEQEKELAEQFSFLSGSLGGMAEPPQFKDVQGLPSFDEPVALKEEPIVEKKEPPKSPEQVKEEQEIWVEEKKSESWNPLGQAF